MEEDFARLNWLALDYVVKPPFDVWRLRKLVEQGLLPVVKPDKPSKFPSGAGGQLAL
jgi:hypothetical protein